MPFGRGNKGRTTQRSHTAAIQRINAARVARRISAASRVSAPGRTKSKAPQAKAPQAKAPQPKVNAQNVREPPPDRGTVRSNQEQIAISLVNNKLDKLLELLNVDDPNTNIIMTFDQLNVRLDNLISSLKEKKKEEERERDRDEQAYRIRQNIQHGAYD
jgi:hypothetical protein